VRRFVAIGEIITSDSVPLRRVSLSLSWREWDSHDLVTTIDTESDSAGRFVVCGVPASMPISATVLAPSGRRYSGTITIPERLPHDKGKPVE